MDVNGRLQVLDVYVTLMNDNAAFSDLGSYTNWFSPFPESELYTHCLNDRALGKPICLLSKMARVTNKENHCVYYSLSLLSTPWVAFIQIIDARYRLVLNDTDISSCRSKFQYRYRYQSLRLSNSIPIAIPILTIFKKDTNTNINTIDFQKRYQYQYQHLRF